MTLSLLYILIGSWLIWHSAKFNSSPLLIRHLPISALNTDWDILPPQPTYSKDLQPPERIYFSQFQLSMCFPFLRPCFLVLDSRTRGHIFSTFTLSSALINVVCFSRIISHFSHFKRVVPTPLTFPIIPTTINLLWTFPEQRPMK